MVSIKDYILLIVEKCLRIVNQYSAFVMHFSSQKTFNWPDKIAINKVVNGVEYPPVLNLLKNLPFFSFIPSLVLFDIIETSSS